MRIFFLLLTLVATFGCSSPKKQKEENRVRVLSTTAMIGDIVSLIGGDRVSSEVLILAGIDPHSYELVRGDSEKIDEAEVLFANGLGLEHGASLRYKIETHVQPVYVGDWVQKDAPDVILWEKGQLDPHIWMDVSIWARIVYPIVETLSAHDPEGAKYYEERGEIVMQDLLKLHSEIKERLQKVPSSKRFLVTSHDAFCYFARAYLADESEQEQEMWRMRFMAPEGLAPDGQLGLMDLKIVLDHLIANEIEVVFPESNVSRDSLYKRVSADI